MVPPSMTLRVTWNPDFKVTTFSDIEYLTAETTLVRAIVTIENQQEVACAVSNGDISSDLQ